MMAKILIADDMPVIREPIAMALERAGYTTLTASNGREVLAVVRQERPDLLLLDIHMPEMSGFDTLRRIRNDASLRDLPVILMTDDSHRNTVVQASRLGIRQYLLKSAFTVDKLMQMVEAALAHLTPGDTIEPDAQPRHDPHTGESTPEEIDAATESADGPAFDAVDPNEAINGLKPILKRSELAEQIEECGELKAMSPTVAEVLRLANNPSASVERIGKAIRQDQAIALKVLRMANSTAYASDEPVDSVDKAVIRIGLKTIGQVVTNIAVVDQFCAERKANAIDPRLFWEHSIACGIIAAKIANATGSADPETAFTMGLLHDVGRFVYSDMLGEKYQTVIRTAADLQLPLEKTEKRMLLIDHADGMDRILHQWKFSRDLIDPIVFHHLSLGDIRGKTPKRLQEVATLALSNRLAHALMLGSSGNDTIYTTHEFCAALQIQPPLIHEIEASVRDETDDLKFAMLSSGNAESWPDVLTGFREILGVPFRPLFIGEHPETDAFRIFCDQIEDRGDEPPNIGILHMTDSRQCGSHSTAFRQAESAAGVKDLPLVQLSPTGKLNAGPSLLNRRRHVCLSTPVVIPRLLATLRTLLQTSASAQAA